MIKVRVKQRRLRKLADLFLFLTCHHARQCSNHRRLQSSFNCFAESSWGENASPMTVATKFIRFECLFSIWFGTVWAQLIYVLFSTRSYTNIFKATIKKQKRAPKIPVNNVTIQCNKVTDVWSNRFSYSNFIELFFFFNKKKQNDRNKWSFSILKQVCWLFSSFYSFGIKKMACLCILNGKQIFMTSFSIIIVGSPFWLYYIFLHLIGERYSSDHKPSRELNDASSWASGT